jgi:hypothetical protein
MSGRLLLAVRVLLFAHRAKLLRLLGRNSRSNIRTVRSPRMEEAERSVRLRPERKLSMHLKRFLAICLLLAVPCICFAGRQQAQSTLQQPAQAAPPQTPPKPLDPQLKASILKLLDVMHASAVWQSGAKAILQQLRPALTASLPPTPHRDQIVQAYGDKLTALLTSQEAMDQTAAIYAKYLLMDDINALIQFYQTPAGQHALTALPQITSESTQIGANLARENIPHIFEELCKEYPELQGRVQFCPAGAPKESSKHLNGQLGRQVSVTLTGRTR